MIISLNRGGVITSDYLGRAVNNSLFTIGGGSSLDNGSFVRVHGKDYEDSPFAGTVIIRARDSSNETDIVLYPNGTMTKHNSNIHKNFAMQEDVVPRGGGAVMTGNILGRIDDTEEFRLDGGAGWNNGASICLRGRYTTIGESGTLLFHLSSSTTYKQMYLTPGGTFTWEGQPIQYVSDQRLKQQINQIDDKLLDAWEDVDLVQFKYNDAVDQKGDTARLHTGYVVQQIDEACKSHNLDISAYGLYCHEEYPERTEEVTTENEDGTTSKEIKVVEPAREYYSLRYTETLVVECAYLRREVSRLKQQNEDLEQRLKMLENK